MYQLLFSCAISFSKRIISVSNTLNISVLTKICSSPPFRKLKTFTKYNLFEFIKQCYDILHLDTVEYVIEHDIANRIQNGICYQER